jgi:hypothetical protein
MAPNDFIPPGFIPVEPARRAGPPPGFVPMQPVAPPSGPPPGFTYAGPPPGFVRMDSPQPAPGGPPPGYAIDGEWFTPARTWALSLLAASGVVEFAEPAIRLLLRRRP